MQLAPEALPGCAPTCRAAGEVPCGTDPSSAPGSFEHHLELWWWCLRVCVCWFAFLLLAVRAELPKKNRQSFLADLSGQLACQSRPFHHYFDTSLLHFWSHFATILEHLGVGGAWVQTYPVGKLDFDVILEHLGVGGALV